MLSLISQGRSWYGNSELIMKIWKRHFTVEDLNSFSRDTMISHLGIVFTKAGDDYLEAEMMVDNRTCQPYGMLHGGASAVLAETLGSVAGNMCCPEDKCCLGLEINASHLHGAFSGEKVTARAIPVHIGISTQVWDITLTNEKGHELCVSRITLAVRRRKQRTNLKASTS